MSRYEHDEEKRRAKREAARKKREAEARRLRRRQALPLGFFGRCCSPVHLPRRHWNCSMASTSCGTMGVSQLWICSGQT